MVRSQSGCWLTSKGHQGSLGPNPPRPERAFGPAGPSQGPESLAPAGEQLQEEDGQGLWEQTGGWAARRRQQPDSQPD